MNLKEVYIMNPREMIRLGAKSLDATKPINPVRCEGMGILDEFYSEPQARQRAAEEFSSMAWDNKHDIWYNKFRTGQNSNNNKGETS